MIDHGRFVPDTSCMVAAVCPWHEHHEQAAAEIERRLANGETLVSVAHALLEAYAVLTRLPPPYRFSPMNALMVLESSFIQTATPVALNGQAYEQLLRGAPGTGIVGGQIHDAVIAESALIARAPVLLTFNERHFGRYRAAGLQVVVPQVWDGAAVSVNAGAGVMAELGAGGIGRILQPDLSPEEQTRMEKAAAAVKELLAVIQ